MTSSAGAPCPCGRGLPYGECCGRLHIGTPAATAEQLMRARYSAFALGNEVYLLESWHPSTRPRRVSLDPAQVWTGLTIRATVAGGLLDQWGTVDFQAGYRVGARAGNVIENSRFVREDGAWFYLTALGG